MHPMCALLARFLVKPALITDGFPLLRECQADTSSERGVQNTTYNRWLPLFGEPCPSHMWSVWSRDARRYWRQATLPTLAWNKELGQFELDKPCHVARKVLEHSRWLHHHPTPWKCHASIRKLHYMMQHYVQMLNLKIMHKLNTKFCP